jgi:iron complex transport system ATP-binding protein
MLLALQDIRARLGAREVLQGVSLTIGEGEFVGLIGPNGAGKSTLLRSVLGLVPATGRITIAGRDVSATSAKTRGRDIAYLPQEREIAWPVAVEDAVALGRLPHRKPFGGNTEADLAAVAEAMARMDIESLRGRPATELSGGEKARVLIARALAQQAPLLLADEPTAGLDPSHQIALMQLFGELAREGRGVIASMHDLGLAARWCTRLILIDKGKVVADDVPEAVLTPVRLKAVYGVEAFIDRTENGGLVVQPVGLTA